MDLYTRLCLVEARLATAKLSPDMLNAAEALFQSEVLLTRALDKLMGNDPEEVMELLTKGAKVLGSAVRKKKTQASFKIRMSGKTLDVGVWLGEGGEVTIGLMAEMA